MRASLVAVGPIAFLFDEDTHEILGVQRKDLSIRMFSLGSATEPFEVGPHPFGDITPNFGSDASYDPGATYADGSLSKQVQYVSGFIARVQGSGSSQVTITSSVGVDGVTLLTYSLPQALGTTDSPTFRDLQARKLGFTGVPSVSSWGTGVGADATPTLTSISGSDHMVKLKFTTSAGPVAGANIATCGWSGGNGMFAVAPVAVLLPASPFAYTAQSAGTKFPIVVPGLNGFVIQAGSVALDAATAYTLVALFEGN